MSSSRRRIPRTRIERDAAQRARRLRSRLAAEIRRAREEAGLSLRRLADAAGVSKSYLHAIESDSVEPRLQPLARVAGALGMDLDVRLYPGSGPLLRDHLQAAMLEALLGILDERWRPFPEVWVTRPLRGVIDLLLEADTDREPLVAVEAQSDLRRLEQQVRWSHAKAEALASVRGRAVTSLLLLRSTRRTRALVAAHSRVVGAAYPAQARQAFESLTGSAPWPGPALLWCDIAGGVARVRPRPPRPVTVGRRPWHDDSSTGHADDSAPSAPSAIRA